MTNPLRPLLPMVMLLYEARADVFLTFLLPESDDFSHDLWLTVVSLKSFTIKKEIFKRTGLIEVKSIPGNFDYKNLESSAFAWLAMKRDQGKLIPKAYLTGAKNSRKLGVIYR